jgi:putative SOS response-associated peptidase YedK
MCGRITQKSPPDQLRLTILMGTPDDPRVTKAKARYNGAPSQELLVIRKHPKTGAYQQDLLRWGLIPNWIKEANPKTKPINATAERVASAPMFRQAYAKCRCIVPVDNFLRMEGHQGRAQTALRHRSAIRPALRHCRDLGRVEASPERGNHPHLLHHHLPRQRAGWQHS